MIYQFSLLERVLLASNVIPHPMTDGVISMGLSSALCAAVKLGITDALGVTPQSAKHIAMQRSLDERGTETVLDCMEALGYVKKSSDQYALTKRGQKYLSKSSPDSFLDFIRFADWLHRSFSTLEDTIRGNGKPAMNLDTMSDHEWGLFSRAMINLATTNVMEVTGAIRLPGTARRLIDLGGSHGLYSIHLCKKYSQLTAIVADMEPVRQYTDEMIAKHGMQKRVTFMPVDFLKQDIGEGHDVALAFNIIHGHDNDLNVGFFDKVYKSLTANGYFILLDQIKGTGGSTQLSRATTSFMAINLLHQAHGNTYTFDEVKAWGVKAGFKGFQLKKLHAPGFALIICKK
jgi:hypothetical protein